VTTQTGLTTQTVGIGQGGRPCTPDGDHLPVFTNPPRWRSLETGLAPWFPACQSPYPEPSVFVDATVAHRRSWAVERPL